MERLDLIPALTWDGIGLLVLAVENEEMRLYLQPLVRRSPLEAFTEFAVPVGALVFSIVAIAVSLLKS